MTDKEIEAVARAFYDTLDNARGWEREPQRLKERLRDQARAAIAAIDRYQEATPPKVQPLAVRGSLTQALGYLMEAKDLSILPVSTFRAVLRGPDHVYEAANHDYFKLVGHRDLFDMSVRDALPELNGQGYYELLDRVYRQNETFVGEAMQIRLQPKPGGAIEEHRIDLVYRPIANLDGETLGLFVEGYDRTDRARA